MADLEDMVNMTDEELLNIVDIEDSDSEKKKEEEDDSDKDSSSEDEGAVSDSDDEDNDDGENTVTKEIHFNPNQQVSSSDLDPKETEEKNTSSSSGSDEPDYKAFYNQVMAPFKANGKTLKLASPEEAIQLMQMGANYTKKMKAIAPYRKHLQMLEDNGLLDEDKLTFLIDISKKDPDAIKKLLSDADIDPLDIDIDKEQVARYTPKTRMISDQEANLAEAINELKSQDNGFETLKVIHSTWDNASKELIGQDPGILAVIHEQRNNGIYDTITNEMDRLQTLGQIPKGVSFLQAYKVIGDNLAAQGAFNNITGRNNVVARKPKTKKPSLNNNDKAKAASPSRTSNKSTKPFLNPLNMSDEEFLKNFPDI